MINMLYVPLDVNITFFLKELWDKNEVMKSLKYLWTGNRKKVVKRSLKLHNRSKLYPKIDVVTWLLWLMHYLKF